MATTLALKDLLALSDQLTIQLNLLQNQISLSDSLSLGDGFKLIEQNVQIHLLADIINLVDSVIQNQQNQSENTPSDNILISDSLQILLAPLLQLADQFTLSDSLKIQLGLNLTLSDSLTFLDSIGSNTLINLILQLSDSLNLSDSLGNTPSSDLDNYFRRYLNDVG